MPAAALVVVELDVVFSCPCGVGSVVITDVTRRLTGGLGGVFFGLPSWSLILFI